MADTAEAQIMEALFARVGSLAFVPALPIAWPNLNFTPPSSQKFLRVVFVPNIANRLFIGSADPHQHLGLLQISVHWPKNQGETDPRDIAGKVAAHFPADLRLAALGIRITKKPDVADLIVEDARVQIPITIEWECWA